MLSDYVDSTNIIYQSLNYDIKMKLKKIKEVPIKYYDTKLLGDKLQGDEIYFVKGCSKHEASHTYCQHILKGIDFDKQMLEAYLKEVDTVVEVNKYDLRYASILDAYAEVLNLCFMDYDKYVFKFSNMLNQLIRKGILDLDKFDVVHDVIRNYKPKEDVPKLFQLIHSDGFLLYKEELYVYLYCLSKCPDADMLTLLEDVKLTKKKGLLTLIHKYYEDDDYIDNYIKDYKSKNPLTINKNSL